MKTIAALEEQLSKLRDQQSKTSDPEEYGNLGERIDFIQDEVDEMEAANREQDAYEEATGTTPQDLYIERNSHAIRQSELIDRFRAEY